MKMTKELKYELNEYRTDIEEGLRELLEYEEGTLLPQKEVKELDFALNTVYMRLCDVLCAM